MDWFSVLLDVFTLAGLSVGHIVFAARITGKEWKGWQIIIYFFVLCVVQVISVALKFPEIICICEEIAALYVMEIALPCHWYRLFLPSMSRSYPLEL